MRGKEIEYAVLPNFVVHGPVRPSECVVTAAAPFSMVFERSSALKAFSSSVSSGTVLSESLVGDAGLVDGLIGVGLAIADVGLVT